MADNVLRFTPLPQAGDPDRLLRVIVAFGEGRHDPEELATELDCTVFQIQTCLDTAIWLRLIEGGEHPRLAPRGLAMVAVEPRRRRRMLAEALWHHAELAPLLAGRADAPGVDAIAAHLQGQAPSLSPARARTQAELMRDLLVHAVQFRPARPGPRGDQLALPLRTASPAPATPTAVGLEALLQAISDHGELPIDQIGSLFPGEPVGALVDAALTSLRTTRVGEALVPIEATVQTAGTFLSQAGQAGLPVAFPSSLALLREGLQGAKAQLRDASALGTMTPRVRVHGGLLAPGEARLRLIPDALTLRLRALTCAPALALLGALLLAGRRHPGALTVEAERLRWRRHPAGPLLPALVALGRAQGWTVIVPASGGLDGERLLAAAEGLGISTRASGRVVMHEALFARMTDDMEAELVREELEPLAARWERWLQGGGAA